MEISAIIPHIEALIFAADRPLTTLELTDMLNNAHAFIEDRASLDQVEAAIAAVREKYASEFYPFEVRETGGGWQFLTKRQYHQTVVQIHGDKFLKRLSAAALETLAIIAYKQPITKGEMEAIRGVSCDYTVQKLLEKELIVITGRNENMPGHPLVYATSRSFMDYFGINSREDLPRIREIVPDEMAEPTSLHPQETETATDEADVLMVTEDGSLVSNNAVSSDATTPDADTTAAADELPPASGENDGGEQPIA
ncbi:MAG TPA: SMC-Scp complex subunit ScpB [Lacibacter sp.]|nr:SMC-Scp complex subunit ScpB [Lacibacter sp.]HMO89489.1 SMC-Scp complex subunit ScpB [Lacibacter sp.]HMP86424.1 SMC-Scp complex subunit ScpB [Lacibacter sp.]